ncbi:unnamed protein product [Chondrus crispus]|uniref:Uncharacterized protein n=1 Tax=Chondrus crispus TaxID=2769 RepID=R7Q6K2_CHOCR|nr:unnamed protein product [Chondrus crispus]CDF33659.1 unnamed protein product [Chondrus crispus]|eukprot:XP_005713478.1 unnamed protein product [Chondrus crispus]
MCPSRNTQSRSCRSLLRLVHSHRLVKGQQLDFFRICLRTVGVEMSVCIVACWEGQKGKLCYNQQALVERVLSLFSVFSLSFLPLLCLLLNVDGLYRLFVGTLQHGKLFLSFSLDLSRRPQRCMLALWNSRLKGGVLGGLEYSRALHLEF